MNQICYEEFLEFAGTADDSGIPNQILDIVGEGPDKLINMEWKLPKHSKAERTQWISYSEFKKEQPAFLKSFEQKRVLQQLFPKVTPNTSAPRRKRKRATGAVDGVASTKKSRNRTNGKMHDMVADVCRCDHPRSHRKRDPSYKEPTHDR